jgi:tryptophan synthase alpha chain
MGYSDMRFQPFTELACQDLVNGVLIVGASNNPQAKDLDQWLADTGAVQVGFVDSRLSTESIEFSRRAGGYLMLQSHDGPTGIRGELDPLNADKIRRVRLAVPSLPIALGFGIGTTQQATQAIEWGADGVIVGSACIEAARRGADALAGFIFALRGAIDAAARSPQLTAGVG